MAVVGVDFGNLGTRIAVAQNRGIDTITNEVNNRTTPTLIQFNDNSRALGEAALSQYTRNVTNTISDLKFLIGRKYADPEVQEEKKWVPFKIVEGEDGNVGVSVSYLNEQRVFSPEFVLGMFFAHINLIARKSLKTGIAYSVVSCPSFFTDYQRRALFNAYKIGGFQPLRMVNEVTAAAYGFGMYQKDLPESADQKVAFVDFGESALQCSIISFSKNGMKVLSSAYDRSVGGRNFDRILATHFAVEIKQKYKIDVLSNPRALIRLLIGCEKTKKVLSANPQAPLHVPCIMDDIDVSLMINRADFENIASPLFDRIKKPLEDALREAGLTAADISAVEQIGGSVRVPKVVELIKEVFGKDPGRRLNSEECVAKGCAMQCAVLSPKFQVQKEFKVRDLSKNGVTIQYSQKGDDSMDIDTPEVSEIFTQGNVVPSTKMMTFKTPERIEIIADYSPGSDVPLYPGNRIGRFFVEKGNLSKDGKVLSASVKVRVRLDENGLFVVDSATLEEEVEIIEEKKVEKKPEPSAATPSSTDGSSSSSDAAAAAPAAATDVDMKETGSTPSSSSSSPAEVEKVVSKTSRRTALKVSSETPISITPSQVTAAIEEEGKMAAHDQLVIDTAEARNALEAYVYDFRPRISEGGDLRSYFAVADADDFVQKLNTTEEWLYEEEGESASKSTFLSRYDELKKRGDFALNLQFEDKHRSECIKSVQANIDYYRNWTDTVEEKYAHINLEERTKVKEKCEEVQKWLTSSIETQTSKALYELPSLKIDDLRRKQDELQKFCNPIVNKPVPAPAPAPAPASTPSPNPSDAKPEPTPSAETPSSSSEQANPPTSEKIPEPMDVDLD